MLLFFYGEMDWLKKAAYTRIYWPWLGIVIKPVIPSYKCVEWVIKYNISFLLSLL